MSPHARETIPPRVALALLLLLLFPTPAPAQPAPSGLRAQQAGVASDHPAASRVGADILDAGGTAVDAAIATTLALGVLNNFASGVGGGGFALVYDASSDETFALDFREVAPARLTPEHLDPQAGASPEASRRGGLAVGVPSEVFGLWQLHQRFGALPWAELVRPAASLAREGFAVHPLLVRRAQALSGWAEEDGLRDEFATDGHLPREGETLRRPRLADALDLLASEGEAAFRAGPIADDLVDAAQRAGGVLRHDDLANYRTRWRDPVTFRWAGFDIDVMPLPSSAGEVLERTLRAIEHLPLDWYPIDSAAVVHAIADALQYAFAARADWMGDPDRASGLPRPPTSAADDAERMRRELDPAGTRPPSAYGAERWNSDAAGTSHLVAVDAHGNAVSLTTTVNTSFGSRVVSERFGVLLNNEMDDFVASPGQPNAFGLVGSAANAVEPGLRPLSSMSPMIVRDADGVVGALGASGGPTILTATLQVLLRLARRGATPEAAIRAPRFHHQWLPATLFVDEDLPARTAEILASQYGYDVQVRALPWAVQALWRDGRPGCWAFASDPRKDGAPAAQRANTCHEVRSLDDAATTSP